MPRRSTPPSGDAGTAAVPTHDFGAVSPAVAVAVGVLLASGLLVPAVLATSVVLVPLLLVLGLLLAWGWPGMLGLASPRGSETALALSALVVTASVSGWGTLQGLRWLAVAGAISVLLVLFHQLLRRDGRPRLAESASGNLLAVTVLVAGACLIEATRDRLEGEVVVALAAGATSALIELLGRWRALRPFAGVLGLLAGAGVGAVITLLPGLDVEPGWAAVIGGVAAAVAAALRSVLSGLPALGHARPRLAAAAASVLVLGPVPLVLGLLGRSWGALTGS